MTDANDIHETPSRNAALTVLEFLREAKPKNGNSLYDDPGRRLSTDDLRSVGAEALLTLGFGWWDEDHKLMLLPAWAYWLLEDGAALRCIDDQWAIKGQISIDLDTRMGCIAYGIEWQP